ncbi:hypothetical protein J5X84_31415 [Streptosporangiaceae bacterium NEAU-GS5]|nr:hypothetical protein [Streptosporangiaceae bacterium NEAU-GS5]
MKTNGAAGGYRPRHGEGGFEWDLGPYAGSYLGPDAEEGGGLRRRPYQQWRVHPMLDPYDVPVREARDSAEHPETVPVAVLFDVTGSMRDVPAQLRERLTRLLPALRAHVAHPMVLFGAIGDATCDRAPLQVGRFAADDRGAERDLDAILLEGGGGGQMSESYELALYFLARHTALDSRERHGKRGVAFLIGDELPYPFVKGHEVAGVFGEPLVKDIRLDTVLRDAGALWDVHFVIPGGALYAGDHSVGGFWRELLGDRVFDLSDVSKVCELITEVVANRVMCAEATACAGKAEATACG